MTFELIEVVAPSTVVLNLLTMGTKVARKRVRSTKRLRRKRCDDERMRYLDCRIRRRIGVSVMLRISDEHLFVVTEIDGGGEAVYSQSERDLVAY